MIPFFFLFAYLFHQVQTTKMHKGQESCKKKKKKTWMLESQRFCIQIARQDTEEEPVKTIRMSLHRVWFSYSPLQCLKLLWVSLAVVWQTIVGVCVCVL